MPKSHFRPAVLILITALILTAVNVAPALAADTFTPTHYIYEGQPLNLTLDNARLAVRYRAELPSASQFTAADRTGVGVTTVQPTGVKNWSLLEVGSPTVDSRDAADLMLRLAASPDIEYTSPVFAGDHGGWIVIMQDVLLRFNEDSRDDADNLLARLAPDLTIVERNLAEMDGAYKLRSSASSGFEVLARANDLAADPRIAWAEPNLQYSVKLDLIPDDPEFPNLWAVHNTGQFGGVPDVDMNGPEAWDITTGDPDIKVVVFDTGIDPYHPDLNLLPGWDFTDDPLDEFDGRPYNPCDNHGTACAGCISSVINNTLGTVGIAPGCKVMSARVFKSENVDPCSVYGTITATWILNALVWADSVGARVTSHSYNGASSSALNNKFLDTYNNGMLHFASAGNGASEGVGYPASVNVVNAISAVTPSGTLASFSNYGPLVDFTAPGTSVRTTDRTGSAGYTSGDYTWFGGTSASSPFAAGAAAMVLSANPALTPPEVEEIMRCTAKDLGDPGFDNLFGYGLPDIYAAMSMALNPDPDPDGDGLIANCDNCPALDNPGQEDADGDGVGDLCDNCIDLPNPDQTDLDSNGIGDLCQCTCACHADPACDGMTDVIDVVSAVSVAFRSSAPMVDPDSRCPHETTDANCDGVTNVLDVVHFVNVGFRDSDPTADFADPCAP